MKESTRRVVHACAGWWLLGGMGLIVETLYDQWGRGWW